jgi:hypothetical protein
MSPAEREQVSQQLQQGAQVHGLDLDKLLEGTAGGGLGQLHDPCTLARLAGALQRQQPGLLGNVLGGSHGGQAGGLLASPAARAALGGIAAMAVKRVLQQRG